MNIDIVPRMAFVRIGGGERERRDSGYDLVRCDGIEVGVMGRDPKEVLHLHGIPSPALLAAIKELLPDRTICAPNVLLSETGEPLDEYGEVIGDEDEEEEDEDDE